MLNAEIRRAGIADVDDIAAAHLDSIRSIGSRYYTADIVAEWGARVAGRLYLDAMAHGEVFFIAIGGDNDPRVLGFSSHRVEEAVHRTAVYVRGSAARSAIGSALFRAAEAQAIAAGAKCLHVASSLAAIEFYRKNGFVEVERGQHELESGLTMPCMFMRKDLF
jgi:GNAT superfamily N-acetyltransferase